MKIERERGISVVTSVMTFEYGDNVFNLLDTPGHEDFADDTYRTLSAVDSRRHGDRRRQGHRAAHAEAVRGLPPARHPDRHLRQQDGPRGARPVRDPRRDRAEAGARHRADHLADRAAARRFAGTYHLAENAVRRGDDEAERTKVNGPDSNRVAGLLPENERAGLHRGAGAGARGLPAVRPRRPSARAT